MTDATYTVALPDGTPEQRAAYKDLLNRVEMFFVVEEEGQDGEAYQIAVEAVEVYGELAWTAAYDFLMSE